MGFYEYIGCIMRVLHVFISFGGSADELECRLNECLGSSPKERTEHTRAWFDSKSSYTLAQNPVENDQGIDFERYEYFLTLRSVEEDEEGAARKMFRRLETLRLPIMLVDELVEILEQYDPA